MTSSVSILKKAAFATAAALLLAPMARAGGIGVDIRIGAPPVVVAAPVVVVAPAPVVVVDDPWVTGYRQNLYGADLRLRVAQSDQYQARVDLDAARAREADLVMDLEDQTAVVGDLQHRAAAIDADGGTIRAQIDQAARAVDDARGHVADAEHRAAQDKSRLDAVRASGQPDFDAASNYHHSQADASAAQADLDDATGRLAQLQARDPRTELERARGAVRVAEDKLGALHADLDRAHDDVYAAQQRLDDANRTVCIALHDRDEALWLLHRDDIISGVVDCSAYGFVIDPGWRRHWHGDIEAFHAYCVHPVDFWVASPLLIVDRIDFVNVHVNEIVRVREIEGVHAVDKIRVVEKFEKTVKVEDRRKVYEAVKVEHERLTTEKTERATAAKEGRRPMVSYSKPSDVQVAKLAHTDDRLAKENAALKADNASLKANNHDNRREMSEMKNTDTRLQKADDRLTKEDKTLTDDSKTGTTPGATGGRHSRTPAPADSSSGTASTDTGGRHSRTPAPADSSSGAGTASTDTGGRHSRTPAPADSSSGTGTASTDTGGRHRGTPAPADSGSTGGSASSDTGGRHSRTPADSGASSDKSGGSADAADPSGKPRRSRGGDDTGSATTPPPPADSRSTDSSGRRNRGGDTPPPDSAETNGR